MTTRTLQPAPGPAAQRRPPSRVLVVGALLLLQVVLGGTSVHFALPGTDVSPYWPNAGLSVIALALVPRRSRPALLPLLFVVAVLANLLGGRALDISLGLGLVSVFEPWVAIWLLTRGADPAPLRGLADLPRLLVSALAGAVVAGVIGGLAVATLVDGDFFVTARTMLASHGAALLVLTPFAMRTAPLRLRTGWGETVAQWACLLGATLLVFASPEELPLTFAPFPFLVWGALRFTTRHTAVQLLAYGALISMLTSNGRGPFVEMLTGTDLAPETVGALLQANLLAAALIALPLSLVRTQQVLTFDRLASQHDMVNNILEATTATAILGTNLEGSIEFFNVGAERITGYPAADVAGKAALAMVPTDDGSARLTIAIGQEPRPAELESLVEKFLKDEADQAVTADWEFLRVDGEVRTISLAISRRYGEDGTPIGYLGVADDVTERRRHEASVEAALETEKQLVDRLAQVDQTKNDFLATVSHELRTPITSILGYSQLLLSDDTGTLPTMHHQIVGRIERNGRRLMGLIEDMLTMSQVEVGNVRFHRVPIDLREPATAALESIQPVLAQRNLTMVHELGKTAVKVSGDADKLERVFTNLLSNAAKFSHEGDTIEVALCTEGHEAVLSVTDTGIGISLEDRAHLFDRFFRSADAHALAIQGVGLGLPIAASIVAGHDGSIDVSSQLGRGSTFAVRLPLITEADPTP